MVFANRLKVGGDLFFSTETLKNDGDYNWIMLKSQRYAHHPEYVKRMGEAAGLVCINQIKQTPRNELGEKVAGTLHFFRKDKNHSHNQFLNKKNRSS